MIKTFNRSSTVESTLHNEHKIYNSRVSISQSELILQVITENYNVINAIRRACLNLFVDIEWREIANGRQTGSLLLTSK